jgi:hypothetical protein
VIESGKTEKGAAAVGCPDERLSAVEHKAMIQPPSEAVHHKPVFEPLHEIIY